jgi:hypothetical protein
MRERFGLLCLVLLSSVVTPQRPAHADTLRFEIIVSEASGKIIFEFVREEGWWPFTRKVANEVFELSVHLPGDKSQWRG